MNSILQRVEGGAVNRSSDRKLRNALFSWASYRGSMITGKYLLTVSKSGNSTFINSDIFGYIKVVGGKLKQGQYHLAFSSFDGRNLAHFFDSETSQLAANFGIDSTRNSIRFEEIRNWDRNRNPQVIRDWVCSSDSIKVKPPDDLVRIRQKETFLLESEAGINLVMRGIKGHDREAIVRYSNRGSKNIVSVYEADRETLLARGSLSWDADKKDIVLDQDYPVGMLRSLSQRPIVSAFQPVKSPSLPAVIIKNGQAKIPFGLSGEKVLLSNLEPNCNFYFKIIERGKKQIIVLYEKAKDQYFWKGTYRIIQRDGLLVGEPFLPQFRALNVINGTVEISHPDCERKISLTGLESGTTVQAIYSFFKGALVIKVCQRKEFPDEKAKAALRLVRAFYLSEDDKGRLEVLPVLPKSYKCPLLQNMGESDFTQRALNGNTGKAAKFITVAAARNRAVLVDNVHLDGLSESGDLLAIMDFQGGGKVTVELYETYRPIFVASYLLSRVENAWCITKQTTFS